jgi:septum formation inhibitor-activating ATPase MinD
MSDQAEVLRQAAQRGRNREPLRRLSQRKSDDTARVVAVTSGKGGVGKTSFVVNLAVVLADLGMRVTILDADLGLANVDVLLGLAARHNLHHVINGTLSLEDILIKGPRDVQIIPGASGLRDIADMGLEDRKYLVESLYKTTRGRDLVIVDTAAGMSRNVLDFVLSAQEIIVVHTWNCSLRHTRHDVLHQIGVSSNKPIPRFIAIRLAVLLPKGGMISHTLSLRVSSFSDKLSLSVKHKPYYLCLFFVRKANETHSNVYSVLSRHVGLLYSNDFR